MTVLTALLKALFILLVLLPALPASFFFLNPLTGRYPRSKKEWIIGAVSIAYVPAYFAIIHHWPSLF